MQQTMHPYQQTVLTANERAALSEFEKVRLKDTGTSQTCSPTSTQSNSVVWKNFVALSAWNHEGHAAGQTGVQILLIGPDR